MGDAGVGTGAAAAATQAPAHPGSASPNVDGSAPSGDYTIKAVTGSNRYHDPSSPVYSVIRADLFFRDPEDASAAGFRSWKASKKAAPAAVAEAAPAPVAPYPGSVLPNADGSAPSGGYAIKAVTGSKRYHDPSSPVYSVIRADLFFRDPEDASAAGFRYWKASKKAAPAPAAEAAATPDAPYPGSVLPNADGSAPSGGYAIKAITGSKRYHDPSSPVYSVLRADVLFRDPDAAVAAGFDHWKSRNGVAPAEAPTPVPAAPYPGSALPDADGSAPAGYRIKAVTGSNRYHDPSSPVYSAIRADVLFRDPDAAVAAGFRYWRKRKVAVLAAAPAASAAPAEAPAPAAAEAPAPSAPAGPPAGSASPNTDGSAPDGYAIKANAGSKRYHDPDSPFYSATRADLWFSNADDAAAAGFVHWKTPR